MKNNFLIKFREQYIYIYIYENWIIETLLM